MPRILQSQIKNVNFGTDVTVVEPVNLYGCVIDSNCFIGPFCEIQSDVSIGEGSRIQSHSFLCSMVTIGSDCFIGHGVMFINDLFSDGDRARGDSSRYKKTVIGKSVNIGSNATILPVSICDNTCIGAGSVVTKDISVPGIYAGNPAKLIRELE
jgi:acetyltransferase-like isoleucine patch superfamily enzyme